jgi:chlorobactene glucosyltransferase
VDDESEDATPAILQGLAAESPRLRVVQTPPRPPGWLGKAWALATGVERARGEWLLFTDADTQHHPGVLAAAVAFAESRHLDMLSLYCGVTLVSFSERAVMPALLSIMSHAGGAPAETNDPHSPVAKASGKFILIRRAVHEAVGGQWAIRGDMWNDRRLAGLVKGRGYRIMLANGRDWVQTRFYRSLREIWEGASKNAFFFDAQFDARASGARALGLAALLLGLSLGPFVLAGVAIAWRPTGLGTVWWWLAALIGGIGIFAQVARGVALAYWLRIPSAYGLLHPVGTLIFMAILLNSTFRILSGRHVTWKGRQCQVSAKRG